MKIIKILPRRGRIYEVRLSDGTYINLDRAYADRLGLAEGMSISEEKADAMEDESDLIRCKNRAMYYLSQSDFSEKKLKEKLLAAGFEERFVLSAIERLKELSYINDENYSVRYLEKCQAAGLSRRQSIEKMVKAGISREKAKEMCVYSSENEQEIIRRLIDTKYRSKINDADGIKKITASLCRRGFAFSDIRAVINEYSDALSEMNEE